MKKKNNIINLSLLFSFIVCFFSNCNAQNKDESKALENEWRKKAKSYLDNPLSLKKVIESFEYTTAQVKNKNSAIEAKIDKINLDIEDLKKKIINCKENYVKKSKSQSKQ